MSFYRLSKVAALENTQDGGLALVVPQRRLVELNKTALEIIGLLDGHTSLDQAASIFAQKHDLPKAQIFRDIEELVADLNQAGVLELKESADMETSADVLYVRNSDVVLREEDQDGALLFNPDTNRVELLNSTGLFIWQQCKSAVTMGDLVAKVKKAFDEVPEDQVAEDVQKFVEGLLSSGFLGKLEESKK